MDYDKAAHMHLKYYAEQARHKRIHTIWFYLSLKNAKLQYCFLNTSICICECMPAMCPCTCACK